MKKKRMIYRRSFKLAKCFLIMQRRPFIHPTNIYWAALDTKYIWWVKKENANMIFTLMELIV